MLPHYPPDAMRHTMRHDSDRMAGLSTRRNPTQTGEDDDAARCRLHGYSAVSRQLLRDGPITVKGP